jgi:hypothetical protein
VNLGMPPTIVAEPGQDTLAAMLDVCKSQVLRLLGDPEVLQAIRAAQAQAPDLKTVLLPLLQDPEVIRAIANAVDEARRQEWKRDCQK